MADYTVMREKRLGIVSTTKGTATDSGVGDGVYVETFTTPAGTRNSVSNNGEMGVGLQSKRCMTDYPEDTASMLMKFPGEGTKILELLGACLGQDGYVFAADTPVAGVNTHTASLIKVLNDPLWFSINYDEGTNVKSFESCVVKTITIELADSILKATVSFVGTKLTKQVAFTNSVTYDDTVECFTFGNGAYCRVAPDDQGTLDAADNNPCIGFSLMIDRGYTAIAPTIGTYETSEEIDNTEPVTQLTLNYGKWASRNAEFLDAHQNGDKKMIELFFQGSIITGVTTRSIKIQLPHMEIVEAPTFAVETPTAVDVVFTAFDAAAAPVPMPGITLPTFIIVNETGDIGY